MAFPSSVSASLNELKVLRDRLPALMTRDQRALGRRIDGVRRIGDERARRAALAEIADAVSAAERRIEQRRAQAPAPNYPPALPITERKADVLAAIRDHQVVIAAGET